MAWISGNRYLTMAEMQNNAEYVKDYGLSQGWSVNAICAILGNMQAESTINPGIWGDNGDAYGLVQWNPYTKYSNWAGAGWRNNGQRELERISYEADHGLQWGSGEMGSPPYSFDDFLHDETTSVETLARYWCYYYERPSNPVAKGNTRASNARYWLNYFDWDDPPIPPDPDPPDPDPPDPPNPDDPEDPDTPPDPPEPTPVWLPPWMFANIFKRSVNNGCPIRLHIYKRK